MPNTRSATGHRGFAIRLVIRTVLIPSPPPNTTECEYRHRLRRRLWSKQGLGGHWFGLGGAHRPYPARSIWAGVRLFIQALSKRYPHTAFSADTQSVEEPHQGSPHSARTPCEARVLEQDELISNQAGADSRPSNHHFALGEAQRPIGTEAVADHSRIGRVGGV